MHRSLDQRSRLNCDDAFGQEPYTRGTCASAGVVLFTPTLARCANIIADQYGVDSAPLQTTAKAMAALQKQCVQLDTQVCCQGQLHFRELQAHYASAWSRPLLEHERRGAAPVRPIGAALHEHVHICTAPRVLAYMRDGQLQSAGISAVDKVKWHPTTLLETTTLNARGADTEPLAIAGSVLGASRSAAGCNSDKRHRLPQICPRQQCGE